MMKKKNKQIPFHIPTLNGNEKQYLTDILKRNRFSANYYFSTQCTEILSNYFKKNTVYLTPSGSLSLEAACLLLDLQPGDEVIMPSFTFSSTANAVILRGAVPVFVDIRPDTMNIDEKLIQEAITTKTRAIMVVHYGGVSCAMEEILTIAEEHNLSVIEDAAQAIDAYYRDIPLGSLGTFGAFSFHETKNIQCGEGGALVINDSKYNKKFEIMREKGTDRMSFFRGEIDRYSWQDMGSSILMSDLNAAFLMAQLENMTGITAKRLKIWHTYEKGLNDTASKNSIELPFIPKECRHNGHIFYIKTKNLEERHKLIKHLKERRIHSVFHYVPLHSAPAGIQYGRFHGHDRHTTIESERLLRLPLYHDMTLKDVQRVIEAVQNFYL